jgi:gluconolactonase
VCADEKNELWRISKYGEAEVMVKDFEGKLLNGPNDVWIRSDGGVYFTDPYYQRDYWKHRKDGPEIPPGVYFFEPKQKKLIKVVDDMEAPNGIIGDAAGKVLYIADLKGNKTFKYEIQKDGTLANKKLFCEMGSDGMTIDNEGNVYLTGKGVTVFDPLGHKIEQIQINEPWTANVCFGGKDGHTLFITASKSIYTLRMRVKGVGSQ